MSRCKNTNFFSEIETFFRKDADNAIQAMINALKAIRLTGKIPTLETKCNARIKTNEKLAVLLLLPFFGCKGPSHLPHSAAAEWFSAGYNMLYRLLRDAKVDWRKVLSLVSRRVAAYIGTHCQGTEGRVCCLVADDTDIAKSGMKMEKIGRVFSHTQHRHILGFKGLLLGITDGVSFRPLDFSLHGERGKGGTQGLTAKQRKARKETSPCDGTPAAQRHSEYFRSKIATLLEMVRRARRSGEDFDYLLLDSWFVCDEVVKAVRGLRRHVLGMLKCNINKFSVGGEHLKTGQMVSRFKKDRKRCRKYRCEYVTVDTDLCGTPVRLFLCRRTKQDGWKTLLTSDTSLSFVRAYEIYAMRWSIEVCFKECKQYLHLEGCQAQYFYSQIAHVSICLMQYSLLSLVKRVTSYETLGGLFRDTNADLLEVTLYERILLVLKNLLEEFTEFIGFPNKELVQKFLSDKDLLMKIRNSNCLRLRV